MRKKSLIVKRKVRKKFTINDLKVKKVYSVFKKITFKKIKKSNFALAVSGGPDSLCMAFLGKLYEKELRSKMTVLIVDHGLRKESCSEALKVKKILKSKKIESKLLKWKGKIPKSNIQLNARNIRFSLISNYCKKNNIKFLLTAHHKDDQIENFFIRLFRGSGLTGLSSMTESSDYNSNLKIVRPLLNFKKEDLKYITKNYFSTYINDPSNEDEKFLRIRIRKYRKKMESDGLNSDKIIKTVNNLISANTALKFYKNKALSKHTYFLSSKKCLINERIFLDEANEIIFKSFSDILSLIANTYYPPRSKKILGLINRVKKNNFTKSTLGGCIIEKRDDFISISTEPRVKKSLKVTNKLKY